MNRRRELVGIALGVIAGVGWGLGPIFFKGIVLPAGVGWTSMLFWRFSFAVAVSWLWLLAKPDARAALRALDLATVAKLLGIGATFLVDASVYYAAISRIDVSVAALLMSIYPAIVALVSMRLGYRLRGLLAWLALAMVVAGTVLTVGGVRPGTDGLGVVLAIAAPIIYVVYIFLTAWIAGERPGATADMRSEGRGAEIPPPVAGAVLLVGTWAAALLLGLVSGAPLLPGSIAMAAWPGLFGIGLFAGAIAIQAFYAASARIGAAQASLMATVEPVVAIALGVAVLGESLSPVRMLGVVIVLAGVVIAQLVSPPESRQAVFDEP